MDSLVYDDCTDLVGGALHIHAIPHQLPLKGLIPRGFMVIILLLVLVPMSGSCHLRWLNWGVGVQPCVLFNV